MPDLASRILNATVPYAGQAAACHPWGVHPIFHIAASLAGLRPSAHES